ncbi:GumC family protein [Hyphobacterium marinum]|uniref:Wzz/FepE/Etk N-terminal domain-containing protein n=1 Tax=Hyphobacterium marinum TaxID=3116574 RepID=A0ABU7LYZ9_9PROT|nr:Wzz/FepE/Etk N-terminal domain-containing protein [Hyphobacterium sp. Y6023]MEE2566789.1 Wzz/FepE/Etk N-terminal domain-containing protein [Hyphobacterium sp. Y6023]
MTQAHFHDRDSASPAADGRPPARGELDLFDLAELAWGERWLIAIIFAVVFLAGAVASIVLLKPSFQAHSRLLVLLDEADPTPGAAGSGGAFMLEQVLQSEAEILNSDAVRRRAVEFIGPAVILGESGNEADALKVLRDGFSINRAPNASVLIPVFEHADPDVAALSLNAVVDSYLSYRVEVLVGDGVGGVVGRRAQASAALESAQDALDQFLISNGLSDFEADRTAAVERVQSLRNAILTAEAERLAATAGAAAIAERLANVPESIEHYVENGASNRLLDLRLERESRLARYQADAPPVVAIEREISELEAFIEEGGANGMGQRRVGANPVRQGLESEQLRLESVAASETRRITTLRSQLNEAESLVARMRGLTPEYQRLSQNVTATAEAAALLATQQAEAQARSNAAPGSEDSVRVIERAVPPAEGSSLKKLGVAAAFLFAAALALFAGLLRGYWRRHLFDGGGGAAAARPRKPSRAANSNTRPLATVSNLPVLARIPDRS